MADTERVLADRYRLISPLGQGGMGTVWRAEHVELGSKVAVKLIDEGIAESPDALGRFKREAKAAATLNSAHVVQIFDYGIDDGTPYIAMELLDGESLGDRLDRAGTLSPEDTLRMLTHAARALDKAHEAGIVHRDMKPDNIFLTKGEDGEFLAKILDFGVAKSKSAELAGAASSHTRTGALVGSPYYMSPEQVRHTKEVDHRTDLWALGVISFECLVGSRPFESDALGDLLILICTEDVPVPSERGPVPEGFDEWFAKACARKPDQRFQSGKEMAGALQAVLHGEEKVSQDKSRGSEKSVAKPAATTAPLSRTDGGLTSSEPKSPKSLFLIGGAIAFVVLAVAVGSFLTGRAANETGDSGLVGDVIVPAASSVAETPVVTKDADTPAIRVLPEDAGEEEASVPLEKTAVAPPPIPKGAPPRPPATTTASPKPENTVKPTPTGTSKDYGF